MMTRRMFHGLAVAAFAQTEKKRINSKIGGVMMGAQTYSFRDRDLDACIAAMKGAGLGYAELFQGHVEPKDGSKLKAWRNNPPLEELRGVRRKFDDAGIELYAFNYSFREDWTDQELARGFDIAKALGVKYITASSNISIPKRLDPLAQENQIYVGFHNDTGLPKPNEPSGPGDFEQMLRGASKYLAINLDIGHFAQGGFDSVSFLEQHHARILTLHIKDVKKFGPAVPFGEGDAPIKQVLQLLKRNRYPIPAMLEYEYPGGDAAVEIKKCFDYCKAALA